MSEILQYRRGDVIAFTSGEWSDYDMCGFVVAITDIDLPAMARKFIAEYQAEDQWDTPRPEDFPSWLVATGHAVPVNHSTAHLGSYGEFSPSLTEEQSHE